MIEVCERNGNGQSNRHSAPGVPGGVQDGGGEACREVGITEAARRLDMPTSSIRNWLKPEARSRLSGDGRKREPVSEAQAEITRLRREVASLKVDNEILRKAAAYFAKGSR